MIEEQCDLDLLKEVYLEMGKKRKEVGVAEEVKSNRCRFWMIKKKRYCRMERMRELQFCAEHTKDKVVMQGVEMERVPCPNDPAHSCFKHLLRKHLKKCNRKAPEDVPAYFQEDVNRFFKEDGASLGGSAEEKQDEELRLERLGDKEVLDLIKRVVQAHQGTGKMPKNRFGIHPSLSGDMCRTDIGVNAVKHLSQIGSILQLIEDYGFLQDNTTFIEFGGGRGSITYYLAKLVLSKQLKNCRFVVIDRTSPRHKKDNKLSEFEVDVTRVRTDIKDLRVGELPQVAAEDVKNVVGVAKHLCGAASDMALLSLMDKRSNSAVDKVSGLCFATCCHHQCDFTNYVGRPFTKNFSPLSETFVLQQMSSWATCGDFVGRIDGNREIPAETVRYLEEKQKLIPDIFLKHRIGDMIKDLFDYGRADFVNSRSSVKTEVVYFTDKLCTLENRVIIGTKNII